jgi:hypothetical protein
MASNVSTPIEKAPPYPVAALPLSADEVDELGEQIRANLIRSVALIAERAPGSEPYDFEM